MTDQTNTQHAHGRAYDDMHFRIPSTPPMPTAAVFVFFIVGIAAFFAGHWMPLVDPTLQEGAFSGFGLFVGLPLAFYPLFFTVIVALRPRMLKRAQRIAKERGVTLHIHD